MRSAELRWISSATLLVVLANAIAADPEYNKVETFEPGKKYSCVPSDDRKSWNCTQQAGSKPGAGESSAAAPEQARKSASIETPPPATPSEPMSAPVESATTAAREAAASGEKPSQLPSYLKAQSAAAAAHAEPVATPAAVAPEQPARAPEPLMATVETPSIVAPADSTPPVSASDSAPKTTPGAASPTQLVAEPSTQALVPANDNAASAALVESTRATVPVPAAAPAIPAASSTPPVESAAPIAAAVEIPATAPQAPAPVAASDAHASIGGNQEFLALTATQYVIELGHSAQRSDNASLRDSLNLTRGRLYELRLNRDGADWWLLVWASFESIDAARSARSQLPTDSGIANAWPRPIGALQKEIRRAAAG